ncbi:MAG: HAMP domain-containing protein [Magnetococcales bacterium]|nr:HAMP domain-containing protein [Magnetococcales bacterium]
MSRMRLGVRGKLFLLSLTLILGVVIIAGTYLEYALGGWLESRIASELFRHAKSVRVTLQAVPGEPSIALYDPLSDRLGRAMSARVTVIADDGKVLGDSRLSVVEIMLVENHGTRAEILEAKRLGIGQSKRYSTTLKTTMLFVAVPFQRTDGSMGYVRVAMSLQDVEEAKVRLLWLLMLAGLFALTAAISTSGLNAHFATKSLRTVVHHVKQTVDKPHKSRITGVYSRDEIGGLAGSFNRLVGELEQSVDTLTEERDRMETVLESMSEGVIALSREKEITLVNSSAVDLLGLPSRPKGRKLEEILSEEAFLKLATIAQSTTAVEIDYPGKVVRRFFVQRTPTRTQEGCCVIVLRDITELHRQEEVRRDFVANVSHELRTPVSIILANVETLMDSGMEDARFTKTLMQAIERHALRLSRIITDLLDLSRLEAGRFNLRVEKVDAQIIVNRVLEAMKPFAMEKGIVLVNNVDEEVLSFADIGALEQVLINLLDNATKYTPAGGRIVIRALKEEQEWKIEVEDNGVGIDPKHHPRLFERFYRVNPGRSQEVGSTGLGLPIVKRLVQNMNGDVGVESAQPSGSKFWFTLPKV